MSVVFVGTTCPVTHTCSHRWILISIFLSRPQLTQSRYRNSPQTYNLLYNYCVVSLNFLMPVITLRLTSSISPWISLKIQLYLDCERRFRSGDILIFSCINEIRLSVFSFSKVIKTLDSMSFTSEDKKQFTICNIYQGDIKMCWGFIYEEFQKRLGRFSLLESSHVGSKTCFFIVNL